MTVMVTGGLGFIGSAFVRRWRIFEDEPLVIVDFNGYAANYRNVEPWRNKDVLLIEDIADSRHIREAIHGYSPRAIIHFAAESHVDNSIENTNPFLHSNVYGTVNLLDQVLRVNKDILFLHVSTDEVFGSLGLTDPAFNENTPYAPRSPYAASKASSDHFVKAYRNTHGLKTIITNCSNNYGPYQHPEKFIPTVILNALQDRPVPIYGNGMNMRDWLHVDDHVNALMNILERGRVGEQYCIGGGTQKTNIELALNILGALGKPMDLIKFVEDRKGHDFRYDIDSDKLYLDTGWKPFTSFTHSLLKTVRWYQDNLEWVKSCRSASESYSQAAKARAFIPPHLQPQNRFFPSTTSL